MKKLLPVSFFLLIMHCAVAQSDPFNMTLLDSWDPDTLPAASGREYNDVWGWVDCDGSEYAIIGSASMIHFFNIDNPTDIQEVANFPGGQVTTWRDMKTYRDRAYAVSDFTSEGLLIFDLSNVQDTIIKTYHSTDFFGSAHNIYIEEATGKLYAVGTNTQSSGMIVLDIATDPDNPQLLASVSLPGGGYIHDVFVRDDIAYCSHGYNGFYVWNFSVPTSPLLMANATTNGYNHSSWVTDDGNYAIYAEEVPIGLPLGVMDLSQMASGNISSAHTFKFPLLAPTFENNRPHNPFIRGNYLIVSYYHDGVQIFDISDPMSPSQVAYYDSYANTSYSGYQGCWGVYPYFPSQTIIASDINHGLLVLSADNINFDDVDPNLTPDATLTSDIPNPFCEGDLAFLNVPTGADVYQWYKDEAPISGNQSFLSIEASGTYRVEVFKGQCNALSEEVEITVNPLPDLSGLSTGDFDLCGNEVMIIEAPDVFDEYLWLKEGNVVQQGGTTFEISEDGNYTLLVFLNGCSSTSDLISITIIDPPAITIDNIDPAFCDGEAITLSATAGGDLYTWYLNGNEIAQVQENTLSVEQAGNYAVEMLVGNCMNASDETSVTAIPLPDVELSYIGATAEIDANEVTICNGLSFVIAVPIDQTSDFQWYNDGQALAETSNTLEVSEAGTYYVEAINSSNCEDLSVTTTVTISSPTASIDWDGMQLTNLEPGISYQWFLNGALIQGANAFNYEPSLNGDYYCITTNNLGCEAVSNTINLLVESIEDIESIESFELFPNPVSDRLTIRLETSENTNFEIKVLHSNGQLIQTQSREIMGTTVLSFDFKQLPTGVYFINFTTKEGQFIEKVIKM